MEGRFDIAVLGAGPAGGHAALTAAAAGLRIALLDEAPRAGGQVWRAKSPSITHAPATPETRAGDALRQALGNSDLHHIDSARVWHIARVGDHWQLHYLQSGTSSVLATRALILATGAREYVQPVPGWTLPGVFGLAGSTALLKETLTPPGQKTVVSGTGPLVFYVAHEIRRLGGDVAAVLTPNTRSDWARALPAMAGQPRLLARGAAWLGSLLRARVPVHWGHAVTGVEGSDCVTGVTAKPLGKGRAFHISADSLCLGHGLIPNIEAAQMLGVTIRHNPDQGGWVPDAAPDGATNVPCLYLCGDGCGIRGAQAACAQGRLAGNRAARDLGAEIAPLDHAAWRRAARFGRAMTRLSQPSAALQALTTQDTVICRCEDLTCAQITAEIAAGAASSNAVKSGLRAGMGPCGGKYCQTAIAALIAAQTGTPPAAVPPPTARPPLRPVPLGQAAGAFSYDDLPIPKPAPL